MVVRIWRYQIWPLLPNGFKLRHIQYYCTVEPLGFLLYLGLTALVTVQPQLQGMRMTATYQDDVFDKDKNMTLDDYEDEMQTYIISWNQYRLAANMPFAIFMAIYLGSWSDTHGRQINILMGIAALMIGYCFAQSILYSYAVMAPLWTWIVLTFVEGCFGNYQIGMFGGQAYQADICPDKDELTMRMNITAFARSVGSALGSYMTAWWSVSMGLVMWVAVGNTIIFVGYIYIFFWIPMIPPKTLERARNQWAIDIAGERNRANTIFDVARKTTRGATIASPDDVKTSAVSLRAIAQEFIEAYKVFVKPRTGYKRGCIYVLALVGFVSTLGGQEAGILIGTYTHYKPLNWGPKEYGDWSTENTVVGTVGQILGILIMKKLLKMRDTWILNMSLISFAVSNIPIAFPTDTNMRISNYLQCLANITSPTLSSLITIYVEPDEVGRVLLAVAVTILLAVVGQTYGLQFIYEATLKWFPGFMFLLVAFLTAICIVLVAWVDYVEKPEDKIYNVDKIVTEEVEEIQKPDELRNGSMLAA